jgi:hypothetical protein
MAPTANLVPGPYYERVALVVGAVASGGEGDLPHFDLIGPGLC